MNRASSFRDWLLAPLCGAAILGVLLALTIGSVRSAAQAGQAERAGGTLAVQARVVPSLAISAQLASGPRWYAEGQESASVTMLVDPATLHADSTLSPAGGVVVEFSVTVLAANTRSTGYALAAQVLGSDPVFCAIDDKQLKPGADIALSPAGDPFRVETSHTLSLLFPPGSAPLKIKLTARPK